MHISGGSGILLAAAVVGAPRRADRRRKTQARGASPMNTLAARVASLVARGVVAVAVGVRAGEERTPAGRLLINHASFQDKKADPKDLEGWTTEFGEDKKDLTHTGRNPYFILEPGYYQILEKGDT